MSFLTMLFCFI